MDDAPSLSLLLLVAWEQSQEEQRRHRLHEAVWSSSRESPMADDELVVGPAEAPSPPGLVDLSCEWSEGEMEANTGPMSDVRCCPRSL